MTSDQHAREYLDYYLDLPGEPEFAVLLEGAWGSGKSHFVDTYFKARFEKAKATDKDAKNPLIHVTLFGVREMSDIMAQMFEQAHPILGGKAAKLINTFGSKLTALVGFDVDAKENANLLQNIVLNLQGRILVFDDLERTSLPLVEVMGFINRFVEHDKLKVIVIASEADIPPDQREEYKGRKEKLIGKTITVGSNPGAVLDAFTARLKLQEVVETIAEQRGKLLATFTGSGRPNFRSLRAILLDYERLVSLVNPGLRASKPAMAQLLLYMIAVGIEFRSNTLDADALRTLQSDMRLRLALGDHREEPNSGRIRASELRQRYEHVSFNDPIVPPQHLANLFTSGSFDIAAVDDHIGRHPAVVGHAEVPAWRLMWHWHALPETEYLKARARLSDELENRKLTHPGQILHAVGSTMRLQRYGDDLLGGRSVADYFADYLAALEAADTLEAAPELFGSTGGSYAGLVYNENDTEPFREIHASVAEASARALSRRMRESAPVLLAAMKANPEDGAMLHEWGLADGKYAGIAILHHIPVADFADLVIIDSKPNDKLLAALNERYNQGFEDELAPEIDWLKQLRTELGRRVSLLSPPYRAFGEMRINYWLKDIDARVAAATLPKGS